LFSYCFLRFLILLARHRLDFIELKGQISFLISIISGCKIDIEYVAFMPLSIKLFLD
jgi:hypothetical protein